MSLKKKSRTSSRTTSKKKISSGPTSQARMNASIEPTFPVVEVSKTQLSLFVDAHKEQIPPTENNKSKEPTPSVDKLEGEELPPMEKNDAMKSTSSKSKDKTQGEITHMRMTELKDPNDRAPGLLAFWLVVIMLGLLFFLVIVLLVITTSGLGKGDILEFGKWTLSVLLGAFGAWIGAGAAYFFGKENLAESSRSTEQAMRIQQAALKGVPKSECIKDLVLTVMNHEFMFSPREKKEDVIAKLNLSQYNGYWWVPVLDESGKGILKDIIHARVFWDTTSFGDKDPISKIISDIDAKPDIKARFGKLHGESFFMLVDLNDEIADVTGEMDKSGAAVGVVVDEKDRPTYCFTKQDLLNVQK